MVLLGSDSQNQAIAVWLCLWGRDFWDQAAPGRFCVCVLTLGTGPDLWGHIVISWSLRFSP